jgi:hypothetical protein
MLLWMGAVLVLLYVGSYSILSLSGKYIMVDKNGMWYREWWPRFLAYRDESNTRSITGPGLCYLPLMVTDRLFWHKSIADHLCDAPLPENAFRPRSSRSL